MNTRLQRRGAVIPLFAVLLPVLVLLCAFAINVAYMQLARTELKIATDAAARAGGRAWSEDQSVSQAKLYARRAAVRNYVAGDKLKLRNSEITFGSSVRQNGGTGRYAFTQKPTAAVAAGTEPANSIRVLGRRTAGSRSGTIELLMGGVGPTEYFAPELASICTQLDRDVALVLDRSGSMAYGADDEGMMEYLEPMYLNGEISFTEFRDALYGLDNEYIQDNYSDIASKNLYRRKYSDNLLNRLTTAAASDPLAQEYLDYAEGMKAYNSPSASTSTAPAPPGSRWDLLLEAVAAFNEVLLGTDQEELVSLGTFSNTGSLDVFLTDDSLDYTEITDTVEVIRPYGGTAIGLGLEQTIPSLTAAGSGARPFAKKTVVIMTDGRQNTGTTPDVIAGNIVQSDDVTIHTVTFTAGADQTAMKLVADVGGGKHYHADTGDELIEIFREIANNLPTIMTD